MGEEKTSNVTMSKDDIRERLSRMRDFRLNLKKAKNEENQNKLDSDSNMLFEKSLDVINTDLSARYNQASQSTAVASMIKDYAEKNGDDWSDLNTPQQILSEYFRLNPDDDTFNRIMDFTNSNRDPEEFGLEMGWIKKNAWDKIWDWTKKTGQNYLSFFDTGGDAVRNLVNRGIGAIEGDQTPGALENYAKMNYGTDFYSLSPEQKEESRKMVSTKEGKDMYEPTAQRIALKGGESALDAFISLNPYSRRIKLGFSSAGATADSNVPVVSSVLGTALGGLDKANEFIGGIITSIPPLRQFRNSLQTGQEKEEFDNFLGMILLGKIIQKRGGRVKNSESLKQVVLDEIDPMTTIKEFQKRIVDAPSDIKEGIESMKDGKATQENLEETAGKIAGAKTVEEQQTATRAFQDSDIKGSKDYETLTDKLKKRGNEIETEEDIEYAKDERRFKPAETRSLKEFEKDGYKSAVMLKPVEDGIALLKDFYEGSPEKMAQLDLIEQKFINEGLTKGEINNISRAISQEYETYKARGQQKTSIAAKDVEDIRRAVKNFAREGNNRLVELDKQWSDNMNTRAMVKDLQDAIVKFKTGKKSKNLFQKLAGVAADIFSYFGGKEFLGKIFKSAAGDNSYTPVIRESDLKSLTNKFTRLNERINGSKNKAEAEKIIEEFNKEMDKEYGPIEGEVINSKKEGYSDGNKYLEDKVEVE